MREKTTMEISVCQIGHYSWMHSVGEFGGRPSLGALRNCLFVVQFLDKHGILQFNIFYEDGAYTADGVNAPIVTFGHSFEELQQNIREVVALFFQGEEPSTLGFIPSPSILTSFALPTPAYRGKA